eukprot:COSAG01_NODE_13017_length_1648_cov_18.973531_3_plen_84_part_01
MCVCVCAALVRRFKRTLKPSHKGDPLQTVVGGKGASNRRRGVGCLKTVIWVCADRSETKIYDLVLFRNHSKNSMTHISVVTYGA